MISLNTSWLRWAVWPLPLGFGRNLPGRAFRQSLTKPRFRQRSTEPRFRQPLTRRAAGPHRMRPRAGPVVPARTHGITPNGVSVSQTTDCPKNPFLFSKRQQPRVRPRSHQMSKLVCHPHLRGRRCQLLEMSVAMQHSAPDLP